MMVHWLLILLCGTWILAAAKAQAEEDTDDLLPPMSPACAIKGTQSQTWTAPLPNVTRALRQRKTVRLLSIGASAGRRRELGGDYPTTIERLLERAIPGLNVEIVDRGISGELAEQAAERLRVEVALTQPDLVLWQVGTNDALAGIPVAELRYTIVQTIHWLRARKVDVILVGLHYTRRLRGDKHYQNIRSAIRKIALSEKVIRIGRYEARKVLAEEWQAKRRRPVDPFELTEDSYQCLAEQVARGLATRLFTSTRKPKSP